MQPSPRGVWFVVFTYGSKASISENLRSCRVLHTSPPSKCDTISKIFGLNHMYLVVTLLIISIDPMQGMLCYWKVKLNKNLPFECRVICSSHGSSHMELLWGFICNTFGDFQISYAIESKQWFSEGEKSLTDIFLMDVLT